MRPALLLAAALLAGCNGSPKIGAVYEDLLHEKRCVVRENYRDGDGDPFVRVACEHTTAHRRQDVPLSEFHERFKRIN